MKFILGSIPNGAGTMVLWFLWFLIDMSTPDKLFAVLRSRICYSVATITFQNQRARPMQPYI